MTPEERALKLAKELNLHPAAHYAFVEGMTHAIEGAVAEEREVCAKLADDVDDSMVQWIAPNIRARGEKPCPSTSATP